MNCCKCQGQLKEALTTKGGTFHWCTLCKGIWIDKTNLLQTFNSHDEIKNLVEKGIERAHGTAYSCPECEGPMRNGEFQDSDIHLDDCPSCGKYFFDDEEMKKTLDYLKGAHLPDAPDIDWSKEEFVKSDEDCPVCEDKKLVGLKGKLDRFEACVYCNGVATKVELLENLAKRSLFGPSMFKYRQGMSEIAFCHHCQWAQDCQNKTCVKCGIELKRLKCFHCSDTMAEYELQGIVIDRCQGCNAVWLDSGEFEKVMTVLPDVKRMVEKWSVDKRIMDGVMSAKGYALEVSQERDRRILINKFWGPVIGAWLFY